MANVEQHFDFWSEEITTTISKIDTRLQWKSQENHQIYEEFGNVLKVNKSSENISNKLMKFNRLQTNIKYL